MYWNMDGLFYFSSYEIKWDTESNCTLQNPIFIQGLIKYVKNLSIEQYPG